MQVGGGSYSHPPTPPQQGFRFSRTHVDTALLHVCLRCWYLRVTCIQTVGEKPFALCLKEVAPPHSLAQKLPSFVSFARSGQFSAPQLPWEQQCDPGITLL